MGRYRPPAPQSAPYITAEGASKLREELRHLWKEERPQVTQTVQEAAKNGDRSENGDYIYGKKRLREIDRRVRYLTKRLESVTIVNRLPANLDKVFFGAYVTLETLLGSSPSREIRKYRIVGADEIDPSKNYISIDSPLAKKLLGKNLGEEVAWDNSNESVVISNISYNIESE